VRNSCVDTFLSACADRDDLFVISGDAGLGVFDDFARTSPGRFLNLGVAEQNMIGFAAGMALAGRKVVVYDIIPFLLYRCYEQVRNDICYQRLPVILVGIGSGVTYAPAGMTHYAVEDLGLARTLPNLTVFSPADPVEARLAAAYALDANEPVYIRLAKRGERVLHTHASFDVTAPQVIAEGKGVAVVFHGSIADEVVAAHATSGRGGTPFCAISVPMVQPLPEEPLAAALAGIRHVVCVEEHYAACGLSDLLAGMKLRRGLPWSLTPLGIPHRFVHEIRSCAGLRSFWGMAAADIARVVEGLA
jgi:transketolase